MKRKDFIRKGALAAAGSLVVPYILPSGRLFASTGSRKVNHVVFCLFAGGVRNIESMQKAEGNLMPNMLTGNESISSDILGGMSTLPSPASTRLQTLGTLYKDFRYATGPTGHYNGHTTAITGKYTDEAIQLKQPPKYPTVFEYYRKHNSPANSALNAWWISDSLGPYPYLNYSNYPGYGSAYGGNMIQPITMFNPATNGVVANPIALSATEKARCELMRAFADGQFQTPSEAISSGIVNTPADAEHLQIFLRTMISDVAAGVYNNPWGVPMNGDMVNLFFGSKIIQEFKPELTVINMQGVDIAHFEFTQYVNNIRRADFALYKLWETIQSTPGMADDTVLIVAPEHGRNQDANSVIDIYGRYALDHNNDEMSRKIFCLIAGPSGVVKQGQVFNNPQGESVDIVPTIANILGFDSEMPIGATDGRVLNEAFN
jgi:hypothetical protein